MAEDKFIGYNNNNNQYNYGQKWNIISIAF